jgi:hypothetical protein
VIEEIKNHIQSKCEALGATGFIFLKGSVETDLPWCKVKTIDDYKEVSKLHKKYSLFSIDEKKGIVYD